MIELLLITGRLAEPEVRKAAVELRSDVSVMPVDVAQFITVSMAADAIKSSTGGSHYSKIIFPGLVRFDTGEVEKLVKMPCFKGPRYASDLTEVIRANIRLSQTEPADFLLERHGKARLMEALAKAENKKPEFLIGSLKIGQGFPPRIIAEIVDAPLLTKEQALARAQYYLNSGADIIDVGAIAGEDNSAKLAELVAFLKQKLSVPISIDSLNPKEINAGIGAGADLVLSLCSKNMGDVEARQDVTYVVIPDSEPLGENLRSAEKLGFKNLIADPILSPPFKTTESLLHYKGLRTVDQKRPMMMGAGNVIELIDADSTGVNGLLAAMAVELDVSLLLTTENSSKTRGSVRELKRALDMCFLARSLGTQPKDLSFDLLMAKGKGPGENVDVSGVKVIVAGPSPSFTIDPKGPFTIFLDFKRGRIIAAHSGSSGYDAVIEGDDAESVSKKIIKDGLVSSLEHAAYLGRELEKAELFLKLRKGYVQDDEFEGI